MFRGEYSIKFFSSPLQKRKSSILPKTLKNERHSSMLISRWHHHPYSTWRKAAETPSFPGRHLMCVTSPKILRLTVDHLCTNWDLCIPLQYTIHVTQGVSDLRKDSGNSGWKVNETRLFLSFQWKIFRRNGASEHEGSPVFLLETFPMEIRVRYSRPYL